MASLLGYMLDWCWIALDVYVWMLFMPSGYFSICKLFGQVGICCCLLCRVKPSLSVQEDDTMLNLDVEKTNT